LTVDPANRHYDRGDVTKVLPGRSMPKISVAADDLDDQHPHHRPRIVCRSPRTTAFRDYHGGDHTERKDRKFIGIDRPLLASRRTWRPKARRSRPSDERPEPDELVGMPARPALRDAAYRLDTVAAPRVMQNECMRIASATKQYGGAGRRHTVVETESERAARLSGGRRTAHLLDRTNERTLEHRKRAERHNIAGNRKGHVREFIHQPEAGPEEGTPASRANQGLRRRPYRTRKTR